MIKSFKKFWKDWKNYCDICSKLRKEFHKKHLFGEIVFTIVYIIVLTAIPFVAFALCMKPKKKEKDFEKTIHDDLTSLNEE